MPMLAHGFLKGGYNLKLNLSFHKHLYATVESDNVAWQPPDDFVWRALAGCV